MSRTVYTLLLVVPFENYFGYAYFPAGSPRIRPTEFGRKCSREPYGRSAEAFTTEDGPLCKTNKVDIYITLEITIQYLLV